MEIVLKDTNIVFDLNGHTISTGISAPNRHYYLFDNWGVVLMKDTSNGSGKVRARGLASNYGKLTINGGNYYAVDEGGGACVWNETQDNSNITELYISGGSFTVEKGPAGDIAPSCISNQSGSNTYIDRAKLFTKYTVLFNSGFMKLTNSDFNTIEIAPSTDTWWNSIKNYESGTIIAENVNSYLSSSSLLENNGGTATLINCYVEQLGRPGEKYSYQANCVATSGGEE